MSSSNFNSSGSPFPSLEFWVQVRKCALLSLELVWQSLFDDCSQLGELGFPHLKPDGGNTSLEYQNGGGYRHFTFPFLC